jgi:hypothetical protein
VQPAGTTLAARFTPPAGYTRLPQPKGSFGTYLRALPLMPHGAAVHLYNGKPKWDTTVHAAVVQMEVGSRDLQQCADAVMRLRGEYLYQAGRYNDIHFNYLSDGKPRYFLSLSGGKTDYLSFRKYMNQIFTYANTRSLIGELRPVPNIGDMQPGDVFIQTGNPYGHAMQVVDVAVDSAGNKVFLLAQSYMPAQEIHVVRNPGHAALSPWYRADANMIETPEWTFSPLELYRFP